jgi:hypothetical protein
MTIAAASNTHQLPGDKTEENQPTIAMSNQDGTHPAGLEASNKSIPTEVEKKEKDSAADTPTRVGRENTPLKGKSVVRNDAKGPISPAAQKGKAETLTKTQPVNTAGKGALSSPTIANKPKSSPSEIEPETGSVSASKDVVERSQRQHPGTISITTPIIEKNSLIKASPASPAAPKVSESQLKQSRASSVAMSSTSRPATPNATENPVRRTVQPKTLRITNTPKAETPPPVASGQSTSTPTEQAASGSKVGSRRPSMTSTAQPSTPVSERVDLASVASASRTESRPESRAASPGPIVGKKRSEKSKAKKQQQKKSQEQEVVTPPVIEDHSPIMARKRKTNKPVSTAAIPNKPTSKSASRPQSPVKHSPVVESKITPIAAEPKKESKKVVEDEKEEPAPPAAEETEIPAPKPKKSESLLEEVISNFDDILNHPVFKQLSSTSHLKNIPTGRPFTAPEEFQHFGGFEYNYEYHPNRVPHDYNPSQPFTEEQHNRYITARLAANEPIRLVTRDGRVSGKYIQTIHGTRVPYLTDEEQDRLIQLENSIVSHAGPGIWGGGNPFWLPNGADLKTHSRYFAQNGLPPLPKGVSRLVNNREVQPRDPEFLINTFVMAAELPVDPRRLSSQDQPHVPPPPPPGLTPASRSYEHHGGASAGVGGATPPRPSNTLHPIDPHRLEASSSGSGTGNSAAMQHDPETAAMFDKLDRVAGGAKKAAAAIGGTHEILRRAIGGPDDELTRLEEQMEAERKKTAQLEKELNAMSKKNKKLVIGARG